MNINNSSTFFPEAYQKNSKVVTAKKSFKILSLKQDRILKSIFMKITRSVSLLGLLDLPISIL
jgi:hypothetical protein